ncbi:MAG: hypothetical protein FWE21_06130 [Defluviitaleaceae bacterium]|nr:hypothetical protein [Defluviitaleaceae bacterium]
MPKNKSLFSQVKYALGEKKRFGESKHRAKQHDGISGGIYSHNTFKNYLAIGCRFAKWAKEEFGVPSTTSCGCIFTAPH